MWSDQQFVNRYADALRVAGVSGSMLVNLMGLQHVEQFKTPISAMQKIGSS
jgi:hypothetical protein